VNVFGLVPTVVIPNLQRNCQKTGWDSIVVQVYFHSFYEPDNISGKWSAKQGVRGTGHRRWFGISTVGPSHASDTDARVLHTGLLEALWLTVTSFHSPIKSWVPEVCQKHAAEQALSAMNFCI
jgi:hypothetical protein